MWGDAMRILNGWKEIAECLNRTVRSARRWERLGLPVRRVSDSSRSPVVAFHHEIELWIRRKRLRQCGSLAANTASFRAARLQSIDLNPNARQLLERIERMRNLCDESKRLQAAVKLAEENLHKNVTRTFPQSRWDTQGGHAGSGLSL